ncbi:hypothetical protein FKM82_022058 [Ascaphus truei]
MIGLPSEDEWPADVTLPRAAFSVRPLQPVEKFVPEIDAMGAQLLLELLTFDPQRRISASHALHHAFFTEDTVAFSKPEAFPHVRATADEVK